MPSDFTQKHVLVTGGSSGIGRAAAVLFAKQGAKVIFTARRKIQSEETLALIKQVGGEGIFMPADLSQPDEVSELFTEIRQHYSHLDCAFLNAGIEGSATKTADMTLEEWNYHISINLTAVWLSLKYSIPLMQSQQGGAIVLTSSVAGLKSSVRNVAYCVAKHGLIGLTRSAAKEYAAENIRINAICPGITDTEWTERAFGGMENVHKLGEELVPMGRTASPEEIANSVLWLCSPEASYVTGSALTIDGGLIA